MPEFLNMSDISNALPPWYSQSKSQSKRKGNDKMPSRPSTPASVLVFLKGYNANSNIKGKNGKKVRKDHQNVLVDQVTEDN